MITKVWSELNIPRTVFEQREDAENHHGESVQESKQCFETNIIFELAKSKSEN